MGILLSGRWNDHLLNPLCASLLCKPLQVYAFGITLWELVAGVHPYGDLPHAALVNLVVFKHMRPAFPPDVPEDFRMLAESCWQPAAEARPSFEAILGVLDALRENAKGRSREVAFDRAGEASAGGGAAARLASHQQGEWRAGENGAVEWCLLSTHLSKSPNLVAGAAAGHGGGEGGGGAVDSGAQPQHLMLSRAVLVPADLATCSSLGMPVIMSAETSREGDSHL